MRYGKGTEGTHKGTEPNEYFLFICEFLVWTLVQNVQ